MAKHRQRLLLIALTGLAIGAGAWLGLPGDEQAPAPATPVSADSASATASAKLARATADTAERDALLASPAVQDYQARQHFAADYQAFIQGAASLDAEERRHQAEALAAEVERREAADELALSEALLLLLGLAQAEGGDEQAQKARADALVARYQALSQRREARQQAPDARFEQYKSEEKRIVDEVLDMQSIPDGLSRDQYLRQRLQEAREQAYQQP